LAECSVRQYYRDIWPLLLLDDCFEALDKHRSFNVLQRLTDYAGQVFVTTPNDMVIPDHLPVHVWEMDPSDQNKAMKIDS